MKERKSSFDIVGDLQEAHNAVDNEPMIPILTSA